MFNITTRQALSTQLCLRWVFIQRLCFLEIQIENDDDDAKSHRRRGNDVGLGDHVVAVDAEGWRQVFEFSTALEIAAMYWWLKPDSGIMKSPRDLLILEMILLLL